MERTMRAPGFALPTVMIASVVMLILLLAGLVSVSSINQAIRSQIYSKYAQEAAESGIAMARACLDKNDNVPTWSDANKLRPNTDCSGNVVAGPSQFVLDTGLVRSTFSVPAAIPVAGALNIKSDASVDLMRQSQLNGTPWRTETTSLSYMIGTPLTFRNVGFGYTEANGTNLGAHFGVILPSGEAKMVGHNLDGRLGDGTTTSRTTPVNYGLPVGVKASSIFTNFLSSGYSTFIVANDGDVYAAGDNRRGMLGLGTTVDPRPSPQKVTLPAGVDTLFVGSQSSTTYIIGSNNVVYSVGSCDWGQLGSGGPTNPSPTCTDRSTPAAVTFPAPGTCSNQEPVSDSGWVQPTNMANDRLTVLLRTKGGCVYAWGANDYGQVGDGTTTHRSTPTRVGNFGTAGQPKATQVAFDGETSYILDDAGTAYAFGNNLYGDLAGAGGALEIGATGFCVRQNGLAANLSTTACSDTNVDSRLWWMSDRTIRVGATSAAPYCILNGAPGSNATMQVCDSSNASQRWSLRNDRTLQAASGNCLALNSLPAAEGTGVGAAVCNASSAAQLWYLRDTMTPRNVPIPASAGTVTRIATDNGTVLFLTSSGQVWGAGSNARGILGIGSQNAFNPALVRYGTFSNVIDLYTTAVTPQYGVGRVDYSNSYVILDDGSVYGTGSDVFGQIGRGLDGGGNNITGNSVLTPTKMVLPEGVRAKSLRSGLGTTVFLTTTNEVYTVGNNAYGQLGDGTTVNSSVASPRPYVNPVKPITY